MPKSGKFDIGKSRTLDHWTSRWKMNFESRAGLELTTTRPNAENKTNATRAGFELATFHP